jgi:hypothetical protein
LGFTLIIPTKLENQRESSRLVGMGLNEQAQTFSTRVPLLVSFEYCRDHISFSDHQNYSRWILF